MDEKPKNPSQDLTDDEKDLLHKLGLKYIMKSYLLQKSYPDPKVYAERMLRKLDSDSSLAFCHTLLFLKDQAFNALFTPKELNKKLAEEVPINLRNNPKVKSQTMMDEGQMRFIRPGDLREGVLEPLEKNQIVLRRNKGISKEYGKPGKKAASEVKIDNRGGRHSYYMTNQEIEIVKQIMKKPQAVDYLYDMILKSGLALKIIKYQTLANLYLIKKTNEKGAVRLLNIGASNAQVKLDPINIDTLKVLLPQIFQNLDDNMLENVADKVSNLLVQSKEFYKQFLPLALFIKL